MSQVPRNLFLELSKGRGPDSGRTGEAEAAVAETGDGVDKVGADPKVELDQRHPAHLAVSM